MENKKILTLITLYNNKQILLGLKKRGLGVGKWNGYGGKAQPGESLIDCAYRELLEEAGITRDQISLVPVGVISYSFKEGMLDILEVNFFKGEGFKGEAVETEEMEPKWFALDSIPYESMWPDDTYWLPKLLRGEKFYADVLLSNPQEGKVLDYKEK